MGLAVGREAASAEYEVVYDTLMLALAEMGVETIPTVGEDFDYNLHMAIQTVPSEIDRSHRGAV